MSVPARLDALRRGGAQLLSGPIARGAIVSLVIRVVGLALGLAQAMLMARWLGPEGYGAFAFAISLALTAATLALMGAEQLSVREVARLHAQGLMAELRGFVRFAVAAVGVAAPTAGALIVIALMALEGGDRLGDSAALLPYVPAMAFLLAMILLAGGIARGFGDIALAQIPSQVIRPLAMTLGLAAAAAAGLVPDPRACMWLALAGAGAALGVALHGMGRGMRRCGDARPVLPRGDMWLRAAGPLFLVSLLSLLFAELQTLMLGWWAGPEQTGLFQPVARAAPLLALGAHTVAMRLAPRIAELQATGEIERLARLMRMAALASTGFAVVAGAALLLAAPWLLGLFGPGFAATAPLLAWAVAAQVFAALCGHGGLLLMMSGRAGAVLVPQALGLAVNAGLGAWLIPHSGALGSTQAMLGGAVCLNLAMWLVARRRIGIDPSAPAALWRLGRRGGPVA